MGKKTVGTGSDFHTKVIGTDQLLDKIKPGQKIFVSSGVTTPGNILKAIAGSEARNVRDLKIIQIIMLGVVKYIATEYGVANLFGESIRERVIAMIDIAHPDHRENLLAKAKVQNYVYADQIYDAHYAANDPAAQNDANNDAAGQNNQNVVPGRM